MAAQKEMVPEAVRGAMISLCEILAGCMADRAQFILVQSSNSHCRRIAGVRLSARGAHSPFGDGTPYTTVLVTHFRWGSELPCQEHAGFLLEDGYGPPPLAALDGWRFRQAYPGLLRLAEAEATNLVAGGDYNWGSGDEDGDDALAENWHPEEMARRIRRLRAEVRNWLVVSAVQDS